MEEIIAKVIPILLLIAFGYIMQVTKMVKEDMMDELKKGVLNIAFPALLFLTFKNMVLKQEYFFIVLITFILLCTLYIFGILINKIKFISHPLIPFMVSTCTFGLLGIPLYGSIFGIENLEKFSIFGIAHEFFIWFIFYTLLKMKFTKTGFSKDMIKGFIKSPLILSIIFGLLINIIGLTTYFIQNPLLKGLDLTLEYLASISTPLILIIIGYGLKINKAYIKQSAKFILIRFAVMLSIGYAFKFLLLDGLIGEDPLMDYGYFTFLILPPPFSLSIFVGEYANKEYGDLTNNTVVLNTIITIIIYIIFVFTI